MRVRLLTNFIGLSTKQICANVQGLYMKKYFFYLIMILLMISLPLGTVAIYYGYRKLTLSYDYCSSYGQVDDVIGWVLKPNASSCLSLKNHLTKEIFFDTKIYTNELGFRDTAPFREVPKNAITLIGDSWTFGYGVNFESSFPHLLSTELKVPTVNMGVPAYGSGSTFQLFSRHNEKLNPSVVIYFTLGLWARSICHSSLVHQTLLPCYFIDEQGQAQFAIPPHGLIESSVSNRVYPGGYLTSGSDFKAMLLNKPQEILQNLKQYISNAFKKIGVTIFQYELDLTPKNEHVAKILAYELDQYKKLLVNTDTVFLLYDVNGSYANLVMPIQETLGNRFIYAGVDRWNQDVASKFNNLTQNQIRVPKDGHFAEGANSLIAHSIAKLLTENNIRY